MKKSRGQATVEYIFLLAVIVFLAFKLVATFTTFFRDSVGNVGHVLSTHLNVGVCARGCFFGGYKNGYQRTP